MRAFGFGLLASVCLSATSAHAGLITDGPETARHVPPQISVELSSDISLRNLISPSMQWSQLEIDSLKAEGLNAGLPYTYTAEMMVKSDLIHSFNVAQIEQSPPPQTGKYRHVVALLILLAGFTMWVGLSFQRRY